MAPNKTKRQKISSRESRDRLQPPKDAESEAEMRLLRRRRSSPKFQLEMDSMKRMIRHFMVFIVLDNMINEGNLSCEDEGNPSLSTCLLDSKNSKSFRSCNETCDSDLVVNTLRKSDRVEDVLEDPLGTQGTSSRQDALDFGSCSTETGPSTLWSIGEASLSSLLQKYNLAYLEDYELEFHMRRAKEIGRGTYGRAFLGEINGRNVVLKQIYDDISFCLELRALLVVNGMEGHQQIVAVNAPNLVIVSEFAGLDLDKWMLCHRFKKTEKMLFVNKMATALLDFHALGYTHNDIKSNNVCIARTRKTMEVTLIDYGLATKEGEFPGVEGSKISFMAPEIFKGEGTSTASDVYSLGFMLNDLVISGRLRKIPDELKVWIKDSLKEDKDARPTLEELVQLTHPDN
ncbi:membrane-associated tyrosine- and threonine-specific cdc2-inhibitory kinase-like [Palaemon carinicauda]|uniref:membrane-associated tyrosine- and threonine-specific cdc2-inhibitory kinase-like n=1 Tax=Palaemon carinicauda TaxID=392227 RepID=UPI0035B57644